VALSSTGSGSSFGRHRPERRRRHRAVDVAGAAGRASARGGWRRRSWGQRLAMHQVAATGFSLLPKRQASNSQGLNLARRPRRCEGSQGAAKRPLDGSKKRTASRGGRGVRVETPDLSRSRRPRTRSPCYWHRKREDGSDVKLRPRQPFRKFYLTVYLKSNGNLSTLPPWRI